MTKTRADRLREARIKAGFEYAKEAADALGVSVSTYAAHEKGQDGGGRNFKEDAGKKYARRFGVPFEWLWLGIGDNHPASRAQGFQEASAEYEHDDSTASPYSEEADRLQAAREAAGYVSATDAARAFGWNETTYRAHESGRRGLKKNVAVRYAKAFRADEAWLLTGKGTPPKGVDVKHNRDHSKALIEVQSSGEIPVIGEIAAGVWQEAIEMLDTGESIPFIPHPRFPKDAQRALRVRGDSCDLIAQSGAYVNTVPLEMALPVDGLEGLLREFEAKGRDLIVVAERLRGGLVEATLKALVRDRAGYALEARSSNPKWAGKIPLTDDMLSDGDETRIARVMIGKYEVML